MLDIFLRVDTEKGSGELDNVVVSGTVLDKSCKIIFTGKAIKFMSGVFMDTAIEKITHKKISSVISLISSKEL